MLQGKDLVLQYTEGGETVNAVDGVSIAVEPGQFIGILGTSGSGKSSLLYLLSGLKPPSRGEVRYGDERLDRLGPAALARLRRRSFGFVFQRHFLIGYLTGRENVLTGGEGDADALLERLDIAHCADKRPHQMSGGERQRMAVARAVIHRPKVVFADEPTASLDPQNGERVMACLRDVTRDGTLVVVTHDPAIVEDADQVLRMSAGTLVG